MPWPRCSDVDSVMSMLSMCTWAENQAGIVTSRCSTGAGGR